MQSGPIDYSYFFFPATLCFFCVGIALERSRGFFEKALSPWPPICLICLGLAVLCAQFREWPEVIFYGLLIPTIPALFTWTKRSEVDAFVGNLSYPIYLVHGLVITALLSLRIEFRPHCLRHYDSGVSCHLLVVERPVDRIRQRIAARRGKAITPVPTGSAAVRV